MSKQKKPTWSLSILLDDLHKKIHNGLSTSRRLGHPVSKGDASEEVWLNFFRDYLPKRYQAEKAFVVDHNNNFSDQIDVVVFDRQYTPMIFEHNGEIIIPAESVYAVFEAKQTINTSNILYAQKKIASVRKLARTSLPIPYLNTKSDPKKVKPILGGILTLESDWTKSLDKSLCKVLATDTNLGKLDLGCIASKGYFTHDKKKHVFLPESKPATAFLFHLISRLQLHGTVSMIDMEKYAEWLNK